MEIRSIENHDKNKCDLVTITKYITYLLRGHPELSSFSRREYTEYAEGRGGGGQWSPCTFQNVDYEALHFHTGVAKINILKYIFGREGGGHKNEYSMYRFIMLTILDNN